MSSLSAEATDALARLTTPYMEDGVENAPLLTQLKDALFNSMEIGSSSEFGPRIPLAIGAFDLYELIENESGALLVGAPHYRTTAGRDEGLWGQFREWDSSLGMALPTQLTEDVVGAFTVKKWRIAGGSPLENILAWVDTLRTDFQAEVASKIVLRWEAAIMRTLYPERRREFLGVCPRCSARYFFDRVSGVRSSAVSITFPGGIARADCNVCKTCWFGGYQVLQMKFDSELKESIRE